MREPGLPAVDDGLVGLAGVQSRLRDGCPCAPQPGFVVV